MDRDDIDFVLDTLRGSYSKLHREIEETSRLFIETKNKLESLSKRGCSLLKTIEELETHQQQSRLNDQNNL